MKTPFALLTVAALVLVAAPARGDQAGAREKLLAAGARLGEHKQSLIEAAKEPGIRALLEAAE